MNELTRRSFIAKSLSASAFTGAAVALAKSSALGKNDEIQVAVVGFRSKGAQHIDVFHNLPGVRVAALCDADRDILAREVKKFTDRNEKVSAHVDVRKVLDDKNIDRSRFVSWLSGDAQQGMS